MEVAIIYLNHQGRTQRRYIILYIIKIYWIYLCLCVYEFFICVCMGMCKCVYWCTWRYMLLCRVQRLMPTIFPPLFLLLSPLIYINYDAIKSFLLSLSSHQNFPYKPCLLSLKFMASFSLLLHIYETSSFEIHCIKIKET